MKTIIATVLSVILFVSLALLPAVSSAQNVGQGTGTYTNTSGDTSTGTSLNNGNTTTGSTNNDGFNPMWLLPLLAIPVAYFIYKAANNDLNDRDFDRRGPLVGAKGGRASRNADDEVLEDDSIE